MNKNNLSKRFILAVAAFLISTASIAGTPVWTFTPLTATSVLVPVNGSATVQYQVTNQSPMPHVLQMTPMIGVTQTTTAGNCTHPFTLTAANPSCTLTLEVSGLALEESIAGGPRVCQEGPNGGLSAVQCYQPSQNNSLNIKHFIEHLTISPSTLALTANGPSGSIVVTSHLLERTATNIAADFTGTALDGNVTQDATDCVSLPAGDYCTLTFTPGAQAVSLSNFPIQGSNTRPVGASMSIGDSVTADIAITATSTSTSGSLLTLQTPSGTGTFTVQNNSTTITATGITADLSGISSVTETGNTCASVAPSATCTLTFTAGTGADAIASTPVPVKGTNTSQVNGSIAVNGTVSLTVTSGSPLALQVNGNSGTMTVKNNSTTSTALNVTADFTNTALSGNVTASTCASIAPSGTCTMTFSPGGVAVVQPTDFSISATNVASTGTAQGAISIGSFVYVTSENTAPGAVNRCPLNADGSLGSCGTLNPPFPSLGPLGIVLNAARTFAYLSNTDDTVSLCPIDSGGGFGGCFDSGAGAVFSSPNDMALSSDGALLYAVNNGNSTVSKCTVDASAGTLSACAGTGSGFTSPNGIVLNSNPTDGNTYAYVINSDVPTLSHCLVSAVDGSLGSCGATDPGLTSGADSLGMALNSSGTILYITNQKSNTVSRCTVSTTDGTVSSCSSAGGGGFSQPAGIALNSSGNTAYIASLTLQFSTSSYQSFSVITICPITSSGNFGSCSTAKVNNYNGYGIALLQN